MAGSSASDVLMSEASTVAGVAFDGPAAVALLDLFGDSDTVPLPPASSLSPSKKFPVGAVVLAVRSGTGGAPKSQALRAAALSLFAKEINKDGDTMYGEDDRELRMLHVCTEAAWFGNFATIVVLPKSGMEALGALTFRLLMVDGGLCAQITMLRVGKVRQGTGKVLVESLARVLRGMSAKYGVPAVSIASARLRTHAHTGMRSAARARAHTARPCCMYPSPHTHTRDR